MTIKGPNAHNYGGGLGDLLGWGGESKYDYADDYDVEAHRRYLHEQQEQRKEQRFQQETPQYTHDAGFSNALNNPPPRQSLQVNYAAGTNSNQVQSSQDAAEAAEIKKQKCDKLKKQAINGVFFLIIFLIWLASGSLG